MNLRICIADGHQLMVKGISDALSDDGAIDVVGLAHLSSQVLALVERTVPDVVLLEHRMQDLDGVECVSEIKRRWPAVHVVILSTSEEPTEIAAALAAGASAYIGKRINPRDLGPALRQVVADVVHTRAAPVAPQQVPSDLTQREFTMLDAISRGLSTKAISREQWISEKTVQFHLTNIYRKLGVHNRTGAMRWALDHGHLAVAPAATG